MPCVVTAWVGPMDVSHSSGCSKIRTATISGGFLINSNMSSFSRFLSLEVLLVRTRWPEDAGYICCPHERVPGVRWQYLSNCRTDSRLYGSSLSSNLQTKQSWRSALSIFILSTLQCVRSSHTCSFETSSWCCYWQEIRTALNFISQIPSIDELSANLPLKTIPN